jgi:hypothetical protein
MVKKVDSFCVALANNKILSKLFNYENIYKPYIWPYAVGMIEYELFLEFLIAWGPKILILVPLVLVLKIG